MEFQKFQSSGFFQTPTADADLVKLADNNQLQEIIDEMAEFAVGSQEAGGEAAFRIIGACYSLHVNNRDRAANELFELAKLNDVLALQMTLIARIMIDIQSEQCATEWVELTGRDH